MTKPTHRILTRDDAVAIKSRLWQGDTQANIALDYHTSVSLIGNIRSGHKWASAEWPNGKPGALPKSRNKDIIKARKTVKRTSQAVLVEKALA